MLVFRKVLRTYEVNDPWSLLDMRVIISTWMNMASLCVIKKITALYVDQILPISLCVHSQNIKMSKT